MSDLTVVTVAENDKGTLDLMLSSVVRFTQPVPNIIICDNGNNGDLGNKYAHMPNVKVIKFMPSLKGGSNRHGEALNKIVPMVKTKRTAIVESDCIVLRKGWDNMYEQEVVAAPKANLYHIFFVLFETHVLNKIDFRPGNKGNRSNRPYKAKEDVGWQMTQPINGSKLKLLEFVDCKSGRGQIFDGRFQSDELWADGKAIVGHLGRGSNLGGKAIRKGFDHPKKQMTEWMSIAERVLIK